MTSDDVIPTWLLAQLKPNCVHIAERNLKRQGFQTFLPLEEVTARRRGKFMTALRPLFPGYIFVAADAATGQWRPINSTYGVARVVSFGQEPAPVPIAVVNQLMCRCDRSGKLLPPPVLKPGDQVRITSGPFADFVAQIETMVSEQRVWVLLQLMGGQTRAAVKTSQLRVA